MKKFRVILIKLIHNLLFVANRCIIFFLLTKQFGTKHVSREAFCWNVSFQSVADHFFQNETCYFNHLTSLEFKLSSEA